MAPLNEKIITGRKFRKLLDKKNKIWLRLSFWTKASDVEFDDGTVLEGKFDTFNSNVNNLSDNVNTLTSELNTLQNSINTINSNIGEYKIRVMTLAQYNALTTKDNKTLYFCT